MGAVLFIRFAAWLSRRHATPPALPTNANVILPACDEEASDAPLGQILSGSRAEAVGAELSGTSWFITYADASGALSKRRITIYELRESAAGARSLMAKCHERNATRQFRIDRISELVDLATGEVVEPPSRVLGEAAVPPKAADPAAKDHTKVMNAVRDPLRVLLFLARADGRACVNEMDVMLDFVSKVAAPESNERLLAFDAEKVRTWIKKQTPDMELAIIALGRMGRFAPPEHLFEFREHMEKLVHADGKVAAEEAAVLRILDSEIAEIVASNRENVWVVRE